MLMLNIVDISLHSFASEYNNSDAYLLPFVIQYKYLFVNIAVTIHHRTLLQALHIKNDKLANGIPVF